jgi:YhcH/YjgK/YiaL family protein
MKKTKTIAKTNFTSIFPHTECASNLSLKPQGAIMIYGKLNDWRTLIPKDKPWLAPGFEAAFRHRGGDLAAPGRHHIDGDRIFIDAHSYTTKPIGEGAFENHRRYVDIQFVISGEELIFSRPLEGLSDTKMAYDPGKDAELFHPIPGDHPVRTLVSSGEFLVLFPGEAHMAGRAPETGPGDVRKLVVKVAIPGSSD